METIKQTEYFSKPIAELIGIIEESQEAITYNKSKGSVENIPFLEAEIKNYREAIKHLKGFNINN